MTTATVHHIQPRVERWAERIREAHGQSVAAILQVGHELLQAKAECSHGEWGELTGETTGQSLLPFSFQTARRYMQIAKHPALSNRAHVRDLPASWGTLAILARLEDTTIEALIHQGRIHPELKRKDAEDLVRRILPEDDAPARKQQPGLALTPEQAAASPPPTSPPQPDSTQPAGACSPPRTTPNSTNAPSVAPGGGWEGGGIAGRPDLGFVCLFGAEALKEQLAREGLTPEDIHWDGTEKGRDWQPEPQASIENTRQPSPTKPDAALAAANNLADAAQQALVYLEQYISDTKRADPDLSRDISAATEELRQALNGFYQSGVLL
jgi:hypothetical protein